MTDLSVVDRMVDEMSIATQAMRVVMRRGTGAGQRRRDAEAEQLVKSQLGDQGQIVTRKLFTDKQGAIYKRQQLANDMYAYYVTHTLPHGDDGSRLLPNRLYLQFTQEMNRMEAGIKQADEHIVADYDQLVAADVALRNADLARQGKPQTAKAEDYPPIERMKDYLYVTWHLEPVPTEGDFRYEVDDSIKARLRQRHEQALTEVKTDVFRRLAKPMRAFVEKLSVPIGEDGSIFRDSLIDNLNDVAALVPALNITGDPAIKALVDDLERVITPYKFSPDALREEPVIRSAAHDRMKELLTRLEGYNLC